jgi:hypothetical protein
MVMTRLGLAKKKIDRYLNILTKNKGISTEDRCVIVPVILDKINRTLSDESIKI